MTSQTLTNMDTQNPAVPRLKAKSRRYAASRLPSPERLRDMFSYDEETGVVRRKIETMQRPRPNSEDGFLVRATYRCFRFDDMSLFAHRIAWAMHYGEWPCGVIDHIDRNGLNNRIANLRDVSPQENKRNSRTYRNNSSGFRGVYFVRRTKQWKVYIVVNDKYLHLGYFDSFDDACAARVSAEQKFGFHANHGVTV